MHADAIRRAQHREPEDRKAEEREASRRYEPDDRGCPSARLAPRLADREAHRLLNEHLGGAGDEKHQRQGDHVRERTHESVEADPAPSLASTSEGTSEGSIECRGARGGFHFGLLHAQDDARVLLGKVLCGPERVEHVRRDEGIGEEDAQVVVRSVVQACLREEVPGDRRVHLLHASAPRIEGLVHLELLLGSAHLMRDPISDHQRQSAPSEAIIDHQSHQEANRGHQRPSDDIRGHSEAIRGHSEAIQRPFRGHQRPFRGHQRPADAPRR